MFAVFLRLRHVTLVVMMANNYYGHWRRRNVKMGDKVLLARSAALAPKFLGSVMTHEPPGEVIGETITGDTKIS